jgi:hypothetical protein
MDLAGELGRCQEVFAPMTIPFQFSKSIRLNARDLLSARRGTALEPVWVVSKRNHHSYVYHCVYRSKPKD